MDKIKYRTNYQRITRVYFTETKYFLQTFYKNDFFYKHVFNRIYYSLHDGPAVLASSATYSKIFLSCLVALGYNLSDDIRDK